MKSDRHLFNCSMCVWGPSVMSVKHIAWVMFVVAISDAEMFQRDHRTVTITAATRRPRPLQTVRPVLRGSLDLRADGKCSTAVLNLYAHESRCLDSQR